MTLKSTIKHIREKSGIRMVRFQFDGKAMKAFVEDQANKCAARGEDTATLN